MKRYHLEHSLLQTTAADLLIQGGGEIGESLPIALHREAREQLLHPGVAALH